MTYRGHVRNGQIMLDEPAGLPEGAEVQINVVKGQSPQVPAAAAEDELATALARKGVRLTIPPPRTHEEIARFMTWQPVTMPGGSLSDELIRDRRSAIMPQHFLHSSD